MGSSFLLFNSLNSLLHAASQGHPFLYFINWELVPSNLIVLYYISTLREASLCHLRWPLHAFQIIGVFLRAIWSRPVLYVSTPWELFSLQHEAFWAFFVQVKRYVYLHFSSLSSVPVQVTRSYISARLSLSIRNFWSSFLWMSPVESLSMQYEVALSHIATSWALYSLKWMSTFLRPIVQPF